MDIHEGVLSVGYGAFYYCHSLEELTLPSTVQSVEEQVLRGCASLKRLNVLAQAAPMCSRDIADAAVYSNAILCVPQDCVGEYGFARVWSKFDNVEELNY